MFKDALVIIKISIHAPRGGATHSAAARSWPSRFQSTLPVGGATSTRTTTGAKSAFQSTLPVGGATLLIKKYKSNIRISIHAPRGGSDGRSLLPRRRRRHFNPRSPWGERLEHLEAFGVASDISIHAPRGGSDHDGYGIRKPVTISIHAPRGGSDLSGSSSRLPRTISIHAPRGGSDSHCFLENVRNTYFNPRSPWGERRGRRRGYLRQRHFNPRSPWGERPMPGFWVLLQLRFQSTLPVGGATHG